MYRDAYGRTVLTGKDILHWFNTPVGIFICGIICCLLAFSTGIKYARKHVEVHSIIQNYAFIEIAGQEHIYELDWTEEEPLRWGK